MAQDQEIAAHEMASTEEELFGFRLLLYHIICIVYGLWTDVLSEPFTTSDKSRPQQ